MDQRIVYLDISHWYALGRAAQGDPISPEHPAILAALQDEVDAGRLMIPLSSVTYEELTENPRDQFREPAADVMWQLSKTATIAPASKIVDEEFVVELNRRFGRPRFPAKVQKFGHGVGFAFGTGRITAVVPPGKQAEIEAKIGMSLADAEAQLEYYILATPGSLRGQIPGFDPNGWRKEADTELAELKVMLDNIHHKVWTLTLLDSHALVMAQAAGGAVREPVPEACGKSATELPHHPCPPRCRFSTLRSSCAWRGRRASWPVSLRAVDGDDERRVAQLRERRHKGPSVSGRPADAVYARQLAGDIRENFRIALTTAGYADTFTMPLRNGEETTDFLQHLPTQRVTTELKIHYAKNSQTNWKVNHLRDIKALSVAIPYTDAVVTDRDACTAATTRTHLDQEFGTPIFSQLAELRDYLGL